MASLRNYESLVEKANFFDGNNIIINTKLEFEIFFNKMLSFKNVPTFKFRGSLEAKYKLYNSAQRIWIENEFYKQEIYYHHLVRKLISKSKDWNRNTIETYFNHTGISPNNDLAYLSFMQHFGVPTPLLDFSQNALVALYFAVGDTSYSQGSSNEIDNYCSFYIIDEANPYLYTSMKSFEKELSDENKGEIDYSKDIASFPILLVSNKRETFKISNNAYIANQQGMFLYNNSPDIPIEESYVQSMDHIIELIGNKEFISLDYNHKIGVCWNIHKSLKPYILSKLKQEGITKSYIYPDNKALRNFALQAALEEI